MTKNNTRTWSFAVSLAGFLFGFDTVVISGANLPIKELWQTSATFHGFFIMSMALWGTVLGSLFGGYPCDIFGRKKTLLGIGILFLISAIGTGLAWDPYSFSFFRFIGGISIGASSVAVPTYLSEIAPSETRGNMVARYQFMIVFGIFIAFFSNYLLKGVGGDADWRFMMAAPAIPSLIYCLVLSSVPESPRWLFQKKGDEKEARRILNEIQPSSVDAAIEELRVVPSKEPENTSFFGGKYSKPILLSFLFAFFNQLSGINFVLYYAPEILERAGLGAKDSLFSSISIGFVNLIFTIVGMSLIDKLGRKTLMIYGSLGYIISLAMVGYAFYASASPAFLLFFICMFIASHAIGQGAVIWVFISEIFPTSIRAFGQAFGSGTHWVFAAIITQVTPLFLDKTEGIFKDNPWPIFIFFAGFMVLQLLFVLFMMPETKGKTLEELEKMMVKK